MTHQFLVGMIVGGVVTATIFMSPLGQGRLQDDHQTMIDVLDELRVCRLELTRGILVTPDSCKSGDLIWPKRQDGMCYVKDAIELIQSK